MYLELPRSIADDLPVLVGRISVKALFNSGNNRRDLTIAPEHRRSFDASVDVTDARKAISPPACKLSIGK